MSHRRAVTRAALTLACAFALPLTAATAAQAAPVEGPSGEAFYTPPATLPEGGSGTLIWYRPASVNLNVELPAVRAWDVLYKSTNQVGEANPVTGMVIVPSAAWSGSGPRPVVDYAEGTQGLGHQCAPSLQITAGTEYDGGAIIAALKKGYAVTVSDYPGYTTGATPEYIAGKSEAHAVLDVAKAAQQLPGSGVGSSNPVIVWGYSQGGQAAGWAGQVEHSYAPELNIKGVAAGGIPGSLGALAEFSEGSPGEPFALNSVVGLAYAYSSISNPEAMLKSIFTEEGYAGIKRLEGECAVQSLSDFHGVTFKQYSANHETFPEFEKHNLIFENIANQQSLGGAAIPVPVYHYHGLQDEFVPVKQDAELHEAWCARGVADDFQLFPGDHLLTDPTATAYVMKWVEERLAGGAAPSTCGAHASAGELPGSARLTQETGDLIVPLPNWQLTGSVTAAKLGVSLKIPAGSTLNGEGDLTSGSFTSSLAIPPINETVTLFGLLPVNIKGALTPAGPMAGTMSLSNSGVLSLNASGGAYMEAKSITIAFFGLSLGCRTSSPIVIPVKVQEAANALSSGSIAFNDEVTIPSFTGCNAIDQGLVNLILSGSGNKLSIAAAPPAPTSW